MSLELHLGIAGFEHSIAIYTTSLLSSIIYIYMFSKQTNKRLSLRQGFKTKSFWFLLAGPYQKKTQNFFLVNFNILYYRQISRYSSEVKLAVELR